MKTNGKTGLVRFPLSEIHPSPENDKLYRPVDPSEQDIAMLAESIRQNGILEPLVLTSDLYILSGHRRYAAAKVAGLDSVPCRVRSDLSRADDPDEFLRLLRESNRQRVKSFDEKTREEIISANPEETYTSLIEHRRNLARVDASTMDLGAYKARAEISAAKLPMLNAIIEVLNSYRDFWPMSDRRIHYALLNRPPLRHASKPNSRYINDHLSYKNLTDLLTRARLTGQIPFDVIADETRPVTTWKVHKDTSSFVRDECRALFKGYWRDLLQSQPNHIELAIEKNTLLGILRPVAMEYTLPITSGRGQCSLPPRKAMLDRFRKSGKEKLVLLIVTDFDPDGETIARSFARSMRDDFGISNVEAVKVALTFDQVKKYALPHGAKAKKGSATKGRFVKAYGEYVFEVEALEPAELQGIVREAIDSVLDIDAFNRELDQEKADSADLDVLRRQALAAIGETAP